MSTRFSLALFLLAAALAGCKQPFCVHTCSVIKTELPPHKDTASLRPMRVSPGSPNGPRIALIDVDGLLLNANVTGISTAGQNPVDAFREKLEYVARRPSCYAAVVLRINSPGGGVTACDIMRRDLVEWKLRTGKPVIACLMDRGAGGAYYLATAADYVVAHPTTITGGIGVILNIYNLQDAMAQFNIEGTPIKAGEFTDVGTPIERIGEEGEEILQQIADEFHGRFRDVVRNSRQIAANDEADVFDGRIFTATRALDLHLIDSIGYLDDALNMARETAGAPAAAVEILHRPRDPAKTVYAITPNEPLEADLFPVSLPGFDRSKLPTFLYMWQPDPTIER